MLILLSLLACGRSPDEPKAPEPKAEPAADPRLAQWFSAEQLAEIKQAEAAFAEIATADAFAAALRQAVALGRSLDPALQRQYDSQPREELGQLDVAWLLPLLPGMKLAYEAEGTVVTLRPDHAAWDGKAKATPQPEDDAFVAAMALAYDNPGGLGWPRWTERTSDEGGCSRFGSGLHLRLLEAAETLASGTDIFRPERESLRHAVLQDVVAGSERFPYCDPQTSAPTPAANLIEEAEKILEQIELSLPEQRQVEARIRGGFTTPQEPPPAAPATPTPAPPEPPNPLEKTTPP